MICLIDNYDSFTYNIVHYLVELGAEVQVILNDEMSPRDVLALNPSHIILSPGPGTPDESGISKSLLLLAADRGIPLLGVCLGHEVIGEVFGASIRHARRVTHGKSSKIHHGGTGIFRSLPSGFAAGRYHSLIVEQQDLPECLEITAWTATQTGEMDEIMGLAHKALPIFGVQFHPESIMTEHGHDLFANFLTLDAPQDVSRTRQFTVSYQEN
ncbi:anthranilate synthase component II [Caldimonas brevitalea]|uniref:Anthranilate synthase component II n=1 Tax=Caldimonas brevitalea TaxID=413882 RepID=A0A0G3BS97_9BURK|nr:aminodeoxychorismate/anthranilate synthase component II [Caldimonas brevitalea]AKJ29425.1 anthranilate synthase component II [Caldimonas brevitalea]